ncbi:class II aldolase/adducin family protein [Jiella sonneratiae]|uniref:Class II aldolase/adducin family protein n=1 Tax=Jiella sonneratiae TaxID=2816856 RepID=A0ABS3J3L8_9HYPH|nr:class II aldolase/adducin family protein [Jiella sonneratiae]MBO0904264.1 class II aldolase/adducin family protein [Jiella sonneratiae]
MELDLTSNAALQVREAIIAACRRMNASGLNQGTSGNISVRQGDGILITPTSLDYDLMRPDDLVWIGFDGTRHGHRRPSSEWQFHFDILKARPDLNAVVHAHPTACTTLSIMEKPIPPIHYMVAVCGGHDIRCAPYATFGTKELSRHAVEALEGRTACLLAHHGMIAAGSSLAQAMWRATEVETLARQYLGCLPTGEPPCLSEEEIENVIQRMAGYGHSD